MKVVVAIDDSPYSRNVLHAVETRHWPEETQFKIVTVVEPIQREFRELLEQEEHASMQQIEHQRKERATELCEKARHRIESAVQGAIVFFEIRSGHAAEEILESAAEWSADRVLLGAHGHSICPHNMPGSVSRKVANHAGCHVEVVRSGQTKERELSRAV